MLCLFVNFHKPRSSGSESSTDFRVLEPNEAPTLAELSAGNYTGGGTYLFVLAASVWSHSLLTVRWSA